MDDNAAVAHERDKENVVSVTLYKTKIGYGLNGGHLLLSFHLLLCRVNALFALCDVSCKVTVIVRQSMRNSEFHMLR